MAAVQSLRRLRQSRQAVPMNVWIVDDRQHLPACYAPGASRKVVCWWCRAEMQKLEVSERRWRRRRIRRSELRVVERR